MTRRCVEPTPWSAGLFALFLGVSLLGACGGDDDDDDDDPGRGAGGTLTLGGASSGSSTGATSGTATMSSEAGESGSADGGQAGASGGNTSSGNGGTAFYLPCTSAADCEAYGGGKVCCPGGSMTFCTKPSACPVDPLP